MRFFHGTNTIALKKIIKEGYIQPLNKTKQQNLCCSTTTMQDDVVYLSTERMFASFYTPKHKYNIENQDAYSAILEIEIPYNKIYFRPDEDYMNDILSYTNYKLYDKYIKPTEYDEYVEPIMILFKDTERKDIDFRYLFLKNKELGLKILNETNPTLSLSLGNVAYIGDIPVNYIKSVIIADIFSTTIYAITEKAIDIAIQKVDISDIDINMPFEETIFNGCII